MMNGRDEEVEVEMDRTAEVLPIGAKRHDILTGTDVEITPTMTFAPRQVQILQNW